MSRGVVILLAAQAEVAYQRLVADRAPVGRGGLDHRSAGSG
jgi:hypothetical protein